MTSKIALITGASRGLGKSAALHLAQQGVDIIVTYHSRKTEAAEVVTQLEMMGRRAVALQLDVGQSATFPAFARQIEDALRHKWNRQSFDFLVNNAGTGLYAPFAETTEAQFDTMVNIHLKSTFFLTQNLLPLIADGGRILNVSSGLTRFASPGSSAYAAVKGGVEVLTRYMAKELGPRGIAANVIAPGAIETDFGGGRVRDNKEINSHIADVTALGRAGLPDDIGGAIAMLLSEESRWINAQRIEVSGGMMI